MKVGNNKEKTKINVFQVVCFARWLQKGVTENAAKISISLLIPKKAKENNKTLTFHNEFCDGFINRFLSFACLEPFMTSPTIFKEIKRPNSKISADNQKL